ncbi:hypothetical protein GCM10027446_20780 [Angustibacter peucedani]
MRNARTRWLVAAVAAAGLGATLVPATSAQADVADPVVVFQDYSNPKVVLKSGAPDGTATQTLTPGSVDAFTYDVSEDGSTMIVGGAVPSASGNDASYGLVLVTGGVTTLLTTNWDTHPALSADGQTAWWLFDGHVYTYHAGTTTRSSAVLFAATGYEPARFEVSPDGLTGVVMLKKYNAARTATVAGKTIALPLDGGAGPRWSKSYPDSTTVPDTSNLAFADDSTLIFGERSGSTMRYFTVPLQADGLGMPTEGPAGRYLVQKFGSQFWSWADTAGVTSFGQAADALTAPAAEQSRIDGDHTSAYHPAAVAPGIMRTAANRAGAHANLVTRYSSVYTGQKSLFDAWNGYVFPTSSALGGQLSYTSLGKLQMSTDGGRTWRTASSTSYDHPVAWPGQKGAYGIGYTPSLTRNTRFRWYYAGDVFTAPGYSAQRSITVMPTITISASRSGSKLTLHGHISRVGGTASLYKMSSGGRKTRIASARISSAGSYSFGARTLTRGTYRIYAVGDSTWATSYRGLTLR